MHIKFGVISAEFIASEVQPLKKSQAIVSQAKPSQIDSFGRQPVCIICRDDTVSGQRSSSIKLSIVTFEWL